ncbi:MAG: hypothetical protein ACRD96_28715 [Bryobacteraceae bacterium]
MRRVIGSALIAFVLGLVTYFYASMGIARWRGEGRFYSVPFGGYTVRDLPLAASALFWMGLWFLIVYWIVRRLR